MANPFNFGDHVRIEANGCTCSSKQALVEHLMQPPPSGTLFRVMANPWKTTSSGGTF